MLELLRLSLRLFIIAWITANRQLIHDRTASRTQWNQSYDFIVVGAGAAGCVVANRLAHNPNVSVLLVEAGGAPDAIYTDIPSEYYEISLNRPDLVWVHYAEPNSFVPGGIVSKSGKTMGGSSAINYMMFSRGNPRDYDLWEKEYGAVGWSFNEVLPFFKRFENNLDENIVEMSPGYHGTDGPVQLTTPKYPGENLLDLKKVFNSEGFMDTDINGANQTGTMIAQMYITADGFRASSSSAYVDPNPYPNNLHILTKAMVTKILFDELTAVGVEFVRNSKTFRVYAQKEVIISAGTINSAQLLMLSGVGPKEHLESFNIPVLIDLPVGNNLKNHPGVHLSSGKMATPLTTDNLYELYINKSGPLFQMPNIVLIYSTDSNAEKEWPNVYLWGVLNNENKITLASLLSRFRSHGTVRLMSSDPFIGPRIDLNFYSDPNDYSATIEMVSFLLRIAVHPSIVANVSYDSIESVGCPPCPGQPDYLCIEGIKCYIKEKTISGGHPSGTCRMGAVQRDDVVVDPSLKLKGAKNVRVCDGSIMPEVPNGNLYAPALMIGEKCAQFIKDLYKI